MWKSLLIGATVSALTLSLFSATVSAGPPCDARSKLIEQLAEKYKETSVAMGLASNGKLLEVLTNATGDTWTIIVTSPEGLSCLVATGEGWRELELAAQEPQA
jgi:hypothetical protein